MPPVVNTRSISIEGCCIVTFTCRLEAQVKYPQVMASPQSWRIVSNAWGPSAFRDQLSPDSSLQQCPLTDCADGATAEQCDGMTTSRRATSMSAHDDHPHAAAESKNYACSAEVKSHHFAR